MGGRTPWRLAVGSAVLVGASVLFAAVLESYRMAPEPVGDLVVERLVESGVDHPVTAVLMNFRAYDTLLEIVVLTAAFWGVWSLRVRRIPPLSPRPDLLLRRVAMVLIPAVVLLAVYLLWAGTSQPGGEFQAGAVLGAAGVLSLLVGQPVPGARRLVVRHLLVVAGAGVFIAVGVGGRLAAGASFAYPAGWERPLIVVVETAAAVSVGFILVALFAGSVARLAGDVQRHNMDLSGLEYRTPGIDPGHWFDTVDGGEPDDGD